MPQSTGDDGVSPVVGMILVLALSVIGIVVTLYWGMPAIDDMKASVEYKAVASQFGDLLREMQDLVTGTASKTSKRWDPTLNRGTLTVEQDTERWVYLLDQNANTRVYLKGVMDDDNALSARVLANSTWDNAKNKLYVSAARISQGHEFALVVKSGGVAMPATGIAWNKGTWATLSFYDTDGTTSMSLHGNVVKVVFQKYNTDTAAYTALATAWSMDIGSIHYDLPAASGTKDIYATNGAILLGATADLYVSNEPPIDPPTTVHDATLRFFARAIQLTGSGSFAGEGKFNLVLNLGSTSALALDVTGYGAKIYLEDTHASLAWKKYFTDSTNGFGMVFCEDADPTGSRCEAGKFTDGDANYVEYWPAAGTSFQFSLLHSVVSAGGA